MIKFKTYELGFTKAQKTLLTVITVAHFFLTLAAVIGVTIIYFF
jgi:hypothetical protein